MYSIITKKMHKTFIEVLLVSWHSFLRYVALEPVFETLMGRNLHALQVMVQFVSGF